MNHLTKSNLVCKEWWIIVGQFWEQPKMGTCQVNLQGPLSQMKLRIFFRMVHWEKILCVK
uniref:WD-repeat protein n=1 Tax=Rhizophora mucronata TaxID=61149 RepID=A0A2P2M5X4_RHIMU